MIIICTHAAARRKKVTQKWEEFTPNGNPASAAASAASSAAAVHKSIFGVDFDTITPAPQVSLERILNIYINISITVYFFIFIINYMTNLHIYDIN